MTAGRRTPLLCALLGGVLLVGCRSTNTDLVESELRHKEALYRESLDELKRLEAHNDALQREVAALRHAGPPGSAGPFAAPAPPPEVAAAFGLKRITLGRGTGGYDNDNLPGDEALQVVVEPRDTEDHVVKVPGSLHVSAIEINPQGLKRPLCWWSLTPEQLRTTWKQTLFSTGYVVIFPWTVFPQCENVRVVVQFKLADGRTFETDRDVRVRPLPSGTLPHAAPPPATALPTLPTLPGPAAPETLPNPTPLLPNPTSFVIPSGAIQAPASSELHWSPAPVIDSVHLSRPRPLEGPTAPLGLE